MGYTQNYNFYKPERKDKFDVIGYGVGNYNEELGKSDFAKKFELARAHLDYLDNMIIQTEVELYVRIQPYYEYVELVSTVVGIMVSVIAAGWM